MAKGLSRHHHHHHHRPAPHRSPHHPNAPVVPPDLISQALTLEHGRCESHHTLSHIMSHPDLVCQLRSHHLHHRPVSALTQLMNHQKDVTPELSKVLVNVTVLGSVGPLRLLLPADATVDDAIKQALQEYHHEGRLPALAVDSSRFELHCKFDTTQALKSDMKIGCLGTRQFILCPRKETGTGDSVQKQQQAGAREEMKRWWSEFFSSMSSPWLFHNILNLPLRTRIFETMELPLL